MKKHIKNLAIITVMVIMSGIVNFSCKEDDLPNNGDPVIYYVRVTDPAKADSLLVSAFLGNTIAIIGDNLGSLRELWFNDQQATLNPAYITNTAVIVSVPNSLPVERNDEIKMVFADGTEYYYNFIIDVPAPRIDSIQCEHGDPGVSMVLFGDYLYEPTVIFPGGSEGEVLTETKTKLIIKVPENAGIGFLTVENIAGSDESSFLFGDTAGMIIDFDQKLRSYGQMEIVEKISEPSSAITGNFARMSVVNLAGTTWWNESYVFGVQKPFGITSGAPVDYELRIDLNVPETWSQGWVELKIVNDDGEYFFRFRPYFGILDDDGQLIGTKTDGWQSFSVPIDQFRIKSDSGNPDGDFISNVTTLSDMYFNFQNNESSSIPKIELCFDNIRIVRKN